MVDGARKVWQSGRWRLGSASVIVLTTLMFISKKKRSIRMTVAASGVSRITSITHTHTHTRNNNSNNNNLKTLY